MIQHNPEIESFKEKLRGVLLQEDQNFQSTKLEKNSHVYKNGDQDRKIYFIESGQIKIVVLSPEGKECIIAVYVAGDIFGENCRPGLEARIETATAMKETVIKEIPCEKFFMCLTKNALLEGFVHYLAIRIADQQQIIANLITVDSEQRLGKTLLQLARKLGKPDPRSIRIDIKISYADFSSMTGATRSRINMIMQRFRKLGILEFSAEHHIIIKETYLSNYLEQFANQKWKKVPINYN